MFEQQLDFYDFSKIEFLPFVGLLNWRKAKWLLKQDSKEQAKLHFENALIIFRVTHQEYEEFLKLKEEFVKSITLN